MCVERERDKGHLKGNETIRIRSTVVRLTEIGDFYHLPCHIQLLSLSVLQRGS